MKGGTEEMVYVEEGGRAASVIFEPLDKYHINDNHGGDKNYDNEGGIVRIEQEK